MLKHVYLYILLVPFLAFGTAKKTITGNVTVTGTLTSTGALTNSVGMSNTRQTLVNLTADNQAVTVGSQSYIPFASDNGTAANRTFVLSQGSSGQILTLEWTGTNQGELADDSSVTGGGNVRLSATWSPTQYDTITLIWNGTDWLELFRSAN